MVNTRLQGGYFLQMKMSNFNKIYVLGAGAVGCFFGGMLSRANKDVTLIARPDRAESIARDGLFMDCQTFQEIVPIKATNDLTVLRDADLVLLTAKSTDTEKIMREIAAIVPNHAVILSLQNGVSNVDIASSIVSNPVYPAVVYVACGMMNQRVMKHHGRGELFIGGIKALNPTDNAHLNGICTLFESSSVPCAVAKDIKRDMWLKFLVNCAYNGLSGIGQICYGEMVRIPEITRLIDGITKEFLAIAANTGVCIDSHEATAVNEAIARTMSTQKSSTAQDLERRKKTEIDYLNGYIVKLGREYRMPTPYNESVYAAVKMLESSFINL